MGMVLLLSSKTKVEKNHPSCSCTANSQTTEKWQSIKYFCLEDEALCVGTESVSYSHGGQAFWKVRQDEVIVLWPLLVIQEQAVQHHLISHQFITINQPTHLIFATWNKANLAGSAGTSWQLRFTKIPATCNINPVTQNNMCKTVRQAWVETMWPLSAARCIN